MSDESNNDWKPKNVAGAIIGFSVFGVAYLVAIVMIFVDIDKRDKMYDADIAEDLK